MTKLEKNVFDFFKQVEDLDHKDRVKACRALVNSLRSEYKTSTVRTQLTAYRKALKPLCTSNQEVISISKALRVNKKEQTTIQRKTLKKSIDANKKLTAINDFEGLIAQAQGLIKADSVAKIATGLCLLTGRRMSEVLKTAKFANWGNNKNKVYFTGQLKGKSEDKSKSKVAIYTLEDRAEIKTALKKLRTLVNAKGLTVQQLNRKYESQINICCRSNFRKYLGRCTSHDLRKAYATICKKFYYNGLSSEDVFLAGILGHNDSDLVTVKAYKKYYIK